MQRLNAIVLTDSTLILQQADLKCQLGDAGYVVFGVILFVWELLPTSLVVIFFRVRNPTKDLVSYLFSIHDMFTSLHLNCFEATCKYNVLSKVQGATRCVNMFEGSINNILFQHSYSSSEPITIAQNG